MATLVEIMNCDHTQFAEIRKQVNARNRFALMSNDYDRDLKLARFWFHDAKYIPLWMYRTKDIEVYVNEEFLNDIINPLLETFDE